MTHKARAFLAPLFGLAVLGLAAVADAAPPPVGQTPAHALTAPDLEAWLDGLVPATLDTSLTPGAVVVVVKDGQVLFEKGYGWADYAKHVPVDAKLTLFRPGSVSKLFTWTAVMQQVEQGRINLDADVNQYLDFRIPPFHGQPVTMRDLMAHRGGFSETAHDLLTFGKAPPPLGDLLKRYVPPRIFTPDGGPGYSNYGAALAGYIVQRVSGEPFDSYVERQIFAPLAMAHSSFRQPLPASLAPMMSKGYVDRDHPGPGFEIVSVGPAGSLAATGDDMSHFMIAHLQNGRYGAGQILSPQTASLMHTTAWKAFPDLNGNLLGFYQQNINGHRVIAHGGDTDYFHSDLALFIDDDVGVFVSVNARGKDGMGAHLRDSLFHGFADRYFPAFGAAAATQPPIDAATARAHARMISGAYINTRRSDSTFLRLIQLLQPTMVTANPDGTISTAAIGTKQTFAEVAPFLWKDVNGHDRLEGIVKGGRVVRWSTDSAAPIFVFVRPQGLADGGLEAPLALGALAAMLLTAVIWPIGALARLRYGGRPPYSGARAQAYRLVRIASALGVIAVLLWVAVIQVVSATNGFPVEPLLHASQAVAFIAYAGGLVAALWNLWLAWRAPGNWGAKSFSIVLTAAFAFMLYMALAYHLIGLSGNF
jgi:CubicO group peptidase (beta-lactamase class C family)